MQCTNYVTLNLPQHPSFNPAIIATKLQQLLNNPDQLQAILGVPPASLPQDSLPPSLSLQQAAERMHRAFLVNGAWKHGTAYKNRSQLQQIIDLLGRDRSVSSLSLQDLTTLKESLEFKKKNTLELLPPDSPLLTEISPDDVICGETIHRYFNLLKKFITFCDESKWLPRHLPLHEVMLPNLSTTESHYRTFTPPELEGIFSSRIYTTNANENFQWTPFSYCFWLPLLGLFTGARPGELCQLYAGDVFKVDNIPVMRVTDEGPEQRLKNRFSARDIPIHPKLVEIGFLDFVEMRRNEGGRYRPLFPELPYDRKHGFARTASRWFSGQGAKDNGYLTACGLYKGEGACLYSFRHTFVHMLRNKLGVQEMMIKKLIGHGTKDDVTIKYGEHFALPLRMEKIAQINPDVDLSHVSWEKYQQLQRRKPHCHKEKRKPPVSRPR